MEQKKHQKKHWNIAFGLPFIGDFTNSMLNIMFIVLGVNLGFTTVQIGWILSAYGITYIFVPIFGNLLDKISRRRSLIISATAQITLSSLILVVLYLFSSSSVIFYAILIEQLLRGVAFSFYWPPFEAYISEMTEYSHKLHKHSINNFCISWSTGMAIGPLIGGFFSDYNILIGFLIVVIAHFISLFIIIFSIHIPEKKKRDYIIDKENIVIPTNEYSGKMLKKVTFFLISMSILFALIAKVLTSYFPNYANLPEGLNWSGTVTGNVIFIFGLGQLVFFMIGRFFKNSFNAMLSSSFFLSILLILLVWITNVYLISINLFLIGIMAGRLYYISLELTMKFQKEGKAKKAGIFESTIGLGLIISPLLAGFLAQFSLTLPFFFFSVLTGIFFIVLFFSKIGIDKYKIK